MSIKNFLYYIKMNIATYFKKPDLKYYDEYDNDGYHNTKVVLDFRTHFFKICRDIKLDQLGDRNILDLGCGTGYYLQTIEASSQSKDGAHFNYKPNDVLFGVDLSKSQIERVKLNKGILIHADLFHFLKHYKPKDISFDLIYSIGTFQYIHPLKIRKLIKLISKRLVINGYFIVSFPETNTYLDQFKKGYRRYVPGYIIALCKEYNLECKFVDTSFPGTATACLKKTSA